jgi:formiminotetrahydrofolate cyclodeaminase
LASSDSEQPLLGSPETSSFADLTARQHYERITDLGDHCGGGSVAAMTAAAAASIVSLVLR